MPITPVNQSNLLRVIGGEGAELGCQGDTLFGQMYFLDLLKRDCLYVQLASCASLENLQKRLHPYETVDLPLKPEAFLSFKHTFRILSVLQYCYQRNTVRLTNNVLCLHVVPLVYLFLFFNWKLETSTEAESTVGAPLYPSPLK